MAEATVGLLTYGRVFRNLEEVPEAIDAFIKRYNAHWGLEKLRFQTPPGRPSGSAPPGGRLIIQIRVQSIRADTQNRDARDTVRY